MPRFSHPVSIRANDAQLAGDLTIPDQPRGIVIFAHGSGSSRFSSRNRFVASRLNDAKLATLLMDLLTPREEEVDELTRELRFDIDLLADRLIAAMQFVNLDPRTLNLPIGLFGASTDGGAALVAAGRKPELVQTVVSRGGRPDLAGDSLFDVKCPVLLIVGAADDEVIQLNRQAMQLLPEATKVELKLIPNATHLFQEPGALAQVAEMATQWFVHHLHADVTKLVVDGLDPTNDSSRSNH